MANNDEKDNLIGFKDIIDEYGVKKSAKQLRESEFNYKMLTFLDKESERLSKVINFCDDKITVLKKYPQNIKLEVELEVQLKLEKSKLVQRLRWDKSPLSVNIDTMLKTHFG